MSVSDFRQQPKTGIFGRACDGLACKHHVVAHQLVHGTGEALGKVLAVLDIVDAREEGLVERNHELLSVERE